MARAESLLQQTAGQGLHDNYVRCTLVSYGASCKVLTGYAKGTQNKVAIKMIPKVRGPACLRLQFPKFAFELSFCERSTR